MLRMCCKARVTRTLCTCGIQLLGASSCVNSEAKAHAVARQRMQKRTCARLMAGSCCLSTYVAGYKATCVNNTHTCARARTVSEKGARAGGFAPAPTDTHTQSYGAPPKSPTRQNKVIIGLLNSTEAGLIPGHLLIRWCNVSAATGPMCCCHQRHQHRHNAVCLIARSTLRLVRVDSRGGGQTKRKTL